MRCRILSGIYGHHLSSVFVLIPCLQEHSSERRSRNPTFFADACTQLEVLFNVRPNFYLEYPSNLSHREGFNRFDCSKVGIRLMVHIVYQACAAF
jgi:hypothetical protein